MSKVKSFIAGIRLTIINKLQKLTWELRDVVSSCCCYCYSWLKTFLGPLCLSYCGFSCGACCVGGEVLLFFFEPVQINDYDTDLDRFSSRTFVSACGMFCGGLIEECF